MTNTDYDIFISYRRDGGAPYARILQLMIAQRGYRVFLDYDELKDGLFNQKIKEAIARAPIFMIVLTKGAIDRCVNPDDWVAQEISEAVRLNKKIIPVNPDGSFDGIHTDVSETVRSAVTYNQYSEIYFGQVLGVTVDQMIRDRIEPIVGKREISGHRDEDYEAAKLTLQKQEAHNRWVKRMVAGASVVVVALIITVAWIFVSNIKTQREQSLKQERLENLRNDIMARHSEFKPILRSNLSEEQLNAIDTIFIRMRCLDDKTWISQTEFSQKEWAVIMGEKYADGEGYLPVTGQPYHRVIELLKDSLYEMTGIEFDLPTAHEWQAAATGGDAGNSLTYAGSNAVDSVAWYTDNAAGKLHPVIDSGKMPNYLDLFNMNGNAAELTGTPATNDRGDECWTVCGGDYRSSARNVTNGSVRLLPIDASDDATGFRIVIRKDE